MTGADDISARFIDRINSEPAVAGPALRPRDAATLLIVRGLNGTPQVLMGRRHKAHKFMPNKIVFPGGRVDRCDARLVGWASDLPGQTLYNLSAGVAAREAGARALGLAAVRETFEETGLIVGTPGILRTRSPAWGAFSKTGHAPNLAPLHYFARATTPPGRPRRFDTRFFMMNAEFLANPRVAPATDELSGVEWLSFEDAASADIPLITGVVLAEAQSRLDELRQGAMRRPVPFYRMANRRFGVERFP